MTPHPPVTSLRCPAGTESRREAHYAYYEVSCRKPDGTRHGPYGEWYDKDNRPKREGSYVEGAPSGYWVLWNPGGKKQAEGEVQGFRHSPRGDVVLNEAGHWIFWYSSEAKQAEGEIRNGRREGTWTEWYQDGKKREESEYLSGKRNGLWRTWFPSGEKQVEGSYRDDRRAGLWTRWLRSGARAAQSEYADGKLHGVYTTWYPNGQKHEEIPYVEGRKQGSATTWDENGAVTKVDRFQEDTLVESVPYREGRPVGTP